MQVWLIKIGEPLPVDGPNVRLYRAGILAETLAELGADVVWWSAAFNHGDKKHRAFQHTSVRLKPNFTLKLLHSRGYANNVSLARIKDHAEVARAFLELAPRQPRPDVIVSALPTPGLCRAAVDFGRQEGLPVLLDLRDKWPDVFLDLLPRSLHWAGRIALRGFFRQTSDACRRATGLIGVAEPYLRWGLRQAGRERGPYDAVMPIGYKRRRQREDLLDEARAFWDTAGVPRDDGLLTVCFLGTLGRQFALDTVIEAGRILGREALPVRLVLCGKGDFLEHFRSKARDVPNVLFPGWVDAPRIQTLMERSQVGLAPYRDTPNFAGHVPNKPAEYLSAGLAVVSSLKGGMADLLEKYDCGRSYADCDARQLAGILRDFASHREQLPAMSAGARRLFADCFDANTIYAAYVEHLARVVCSVRDVPRTLPRAA